MSFASLIDLMDYSRECLNFYGTDCMTLNELLKKSETGKRIGVITEAYLIANGMCHHVCSFIKENYNVENVSAYIQEHPIFDTKEELDEYKIEMENLMKRAVSLQTVFKYDVRREKAIKMQKILEYCIGEYYSERISFLYLNFRIDMDDVAKCLLIFEDNEDISIFEEMKRPIIKPLKYNEYKRNVEGLL